MNTAWINQYRSIPLLPYSELCILVVKAQKGCIESRHKILNANIRLVLKVASKYAWAVTAVFDIDDLFQEGIMGVNRAVDLFDVNRELQFSTYAEPWIKQRIMRYISTHKSIVRLPQYIIGIQQRFKKLKSEDQQRDDDFYIALLAKELNKQPEDVLEIMNLHIHSQSLIVSDEEERTIDLQQPISSQNEAIKELKLLNVNALLRMLTYREKLVFIRRAEGVTLNLIGIELECSRERVRQIETIALRKMKAVTNLLVRQLK